MTAVTRVKALVSYILPFWGVGGWTLYSDKDPSFVSALFGHVNALLGIYVTSRPHRDQLDPTDLLVAAARHSKCE